MERVLARLRSEFVAGGEAAHLERLKLFLLGHCADVPCAELARDLQTTEGAQVAIDRLRKRYRAGLRAEIAETVTDPSEIEGEIRYLVGVPAYEIKVAGM
jgi:RNA polymerase sigma-70 factor (ECF subfamily)